MFKNKVVVITGAAGGIGGATTINFAKSSAKLALIDFDSDNLKKIAQACEKYDKIVTIVADLSKDSEIDAAVDSILKEYRKIDVLVNCHAIAGFVIPSDLNFMELYDKTMCVNLRSIVYLTHRVLPALIKSKGNIVNISSTAAILAAKGCVPYHVSKAGLSHFTKCIALEYATQVRANLILPGPVRTDILARNGVIDGDKVDEFWETFAITVPMKKVMEPQEIADLVEYLASDKAKSVTGSEFVIDCGLILSGMGNNELNAKS